jgi:hypothetical protein
MVISVGADIDWNRKSVERNLERVRTELGFLDDGKTLVEPLSLMKVGFWEVARINPPQEFFKSGRLVKLSDLITLTEQVNEQIRSRESYKPHNGAMDNCSIVIRIYDEMLRRSMSQMQELIVEYQSSNAHPAVLGDAPKDGVPLN